MLSIDCALNPISTTLKYKHNNNVLFVVGKLNGINLNLNCVNIFVNIIKSIYVKILESL